ncbi:MAG TPA: hypothetical protein VFB62_11980 [Polyangiaceae bacterium]|jgi:hypothetical protein|nr:hypothetical protein [Polyangiaceae bacterium]
MKPHAISTIAAFCFTGSFAACELALGLDDKTFCDDAPEQCDTGQTVSTTSAGGSAGSSSSAGGEGGEGGAGCDDYEFNEEWEAGALAGWQTLDDGDNDIFDPMGVLHIEPDIDDYWWDNERAPFVYREVCGDFGIHIHIDTVEPLNSLMPSQQFNGGGILVRNPQPAAGAFSEHWLLLSHGFQMEGMGAAGYWSGPRDGGMFLQTEALYAPPVLGGQLALCRFEGQWHAYYLQDCSDSPQILFGEPEETVALPDRVQVGVTVHRRNMEALKGAFRWTNLFRPRNLEDCLNVLDTTYVPDYQCP